MNRRELFLLSVTVFLTIIAWIIADLYHISTTRRFEPGTIPNSTPLNVSIDTSILGVLEQRQ